MTDDPANNGFFAGSFASITYFLQRNNLTESRRERASASCAYIHYVNHMEYEIRDFPEKTRFLFLIAPSVATLCGEKPGNGLDTASSVVAGMRVSVTAPYEQCVCDYAIVSLFKGCNNRDSIDVLMAFSYTGLLLLFEFVLNRL